MTVFFSQLINGLSLGSIYALIALGYSMVYGIILLLNFAHGDVIMVGAYMSWFVMNQLGLGPVTAVCATILTCTLLGVVIEKAVSSEPISEKYQRDIEALRQKYGDAFKTGLCINLTLQEALSIMHRERKRIDAYSGLVSYLKKEWNITLTITSQKTKPKSL
jgi:branched-subunit amino acid ABC-type transport system permease component